MKSGKLLAVALGTASTQLVTGVAHAQTQVGSGAPGQSKAEVEVNGIADIVVTAQRRAENLQKSSLSISVLTPEAIGRQGVTRTEDIARVAPGVEIGTAGPTPQIFVRGVGDPGNTSLTNPAIALNVGGVYYARPHAAGLSFYDLERIEVLKGPQGTLYGRNASGGAINILPAKPELGQLGAVLNLEAGNYEALSSDGAVNLPLGQNAAMRVSYQVRNRDGFLSDGSNDDIRQAVRVQLLFQPSEALSVLLFGSYGHQGGIGNGYALYDPKGNPFGTPPRPSVGRFDPWTGSTDPRGSVITASSLPPPLLAPGNASDLYQDNAFWNFHGELNADLGFATLTVIPSYQRSTLNYRIYPALSYQTVDRGGQGKPEASEAYSGEIRLSNETERLKWVLGAFYYNEDQYYAVTVNNGLVQNVSQTADIKTRSVAAFGQATFSISDTFRVIGGLRYTDDKRDLDGTRASNLPVPGTAPTPIFGSSQSSSTDFRVGFEYDLAPQNMLYGSYATGYKAGGVSAAIARSFEPEKVKASTVGIRNRFFDSRLQINLEGFYLDYTNQHVQVSAPDDVGILSGLVRNAGKAKSYGGEASIVFQATPNDNITASVVYNETRYDSFVFQAPLLALPAGRTGCPVTPTGAVGPVGPVGQVDCSGRVLPRAPKWSGNVGYNHVFELGDGGSVTFDGNMQFASTREGTGDYIANSRLPAYQLFNASLTYALASEKLSVTAFVRNITDEAVYLGGFQSAFAPSFVAMSIAPPRTYGLRIAYRY